MDKITAALLNEFSTEFELGALPEDQTFEHFSTYLTVRRHYSEAAFDTSELVMGNGGDTGIDAIAIIVNNNLVTDIDTVDELVSINGFLDVTFVFIQAERTSGFSTSKIGQFGFGVRDFFGDKKLVGNESIKAAAAIMDHIFKLSSKFKGKNPACHLYYVTTGKWTEQNDLKVRAEAEVNDLKSTGNFRTVEFHQIGADQIQSLYNLSKNSIQREFVFSQKLVVPDITGVKEAYLGYMAATDILKLVRDEQGDIIKSLFYDNIRDWEGYNQINGEMKAALSSEIRNRFVLMNNGVTIIAKSLQPTGNRFVMGDFQIVNGCQTIHVLHDNEKLLSESVRIPLRIISTQDESVIESIITATNRQTEVSAYQFFALKSFAKKLEVYFRTAFDGDKRLYYERRTHQYDSQSDIPKPRIVTHQALVRAVGAMFLGEPHRTTRDFRSLYEKVGRDFFLDSDRMEPYYVAAYAAFRLEELFKAKTLPGSYKSGRHHILLAARLLMDKTPLPAMNSNQMGKRCDGMNKKLWTDADKVLQEAVKIVGKVAKSNWDRDHIRTQVLTDGIFAYFGLKSRGS